MQERSKILTLSNSRGEELVFTLRKCDRNDIEDILNTQETVLNLLDSQHVFVRTSAEDILESLDVDVLIGAYCGEKPAGFSLMVANRVTWRNLGSYLDYDDDMLRLSATYDTTFVLPEYRGYGLQAQFAELKDEAARSMGAVEALATVAPENTVSLMNSLEHGFELVATMPVYGGLTRCMLRKKLTENK